MDEIEAMKAIADKLEKLSDDERARILGWTNSKYGFQAPATPAQKPAQSNDPEPALKAALNAATAAKLKASRSRSRSFRWIIA